MEMDLNSDPKALEEEILENQDLFLTSEATDYGRQLHDEYFYHDELWSRCIWVEHGLLL